MFAVEVFAAEHLKVRLTVTIMRVVINGIGGRMGSETARLLIGGYKGMFLAAGVDKGETETPVSCYRRLTEVRESFDCVIDFSVHSAARELVDFCVSYKKPVVIATTGHTEEEISIIKEASKYIPVFFSGNMSVGVALLCELAKTAAKTFPDTDIEIVEVHRNRKLDAPSGTALMLADAVRSVREELYCVFGRKGHAKREKNEIGVHSLRMGNVAGEHSVIMSTDTQMITLKHEALDRILFAEGACEAAQFICGKPPGLYDMKNIIEKWDDNQE